MYLSTIWLFGGGSDYFWLGQSGKECRHLTPAQMNGLDLDPSTSGRRAFLPELTAQAMCKETRMQGALEGNNGGVQLAEVKRLL